MINICSDFSSRLNFSAYIFMTLHKACFSSSILTDGEEVPNDRCCRTCGKIGHFSKDCPRSRKNMKKLMKDPNYIQAWFGTSLAASFLDTVLIVEHCVSYRTHSFWTITLSSLRYSHPIRIISRNRKKYQNPIKEITAMKCYVCQQTGHIAKQCSQRGQPRHHRGQHNDHQKYDKKRSKVSGFQSKCSRSIYTQIKA